MALAEELVSGIRSGAYDEVFHRLYGGGEGMAERQRDRYCQAIQCFETAYGKGRQLALYSTPGRTEIGGNHTDHNNGVVMAAAINLDIIAVVAQNDESVVRVTSEGFAGEDVVDLARLEPDGAEAGRSSALIRGVAAGLVDRGGAIGGFDAYTTSDVLKGSGLSSSAAFEVCLGAIFNGEYNNGRFSPIELGIIGQHAENVFFGKPSGLMDQLACAVGGAITIDFADTARPAVGQIPVDLAEYGFNLVITDTKGDHADLTDDYAAIRYEMESVASCFGKQVLRQVPQKAFLADVANLRQKVGDRAVLRAVHFYEECRRVGVLAEALQKKDFTTFLRTIVEGGHSSFELNQNAYSLKHPQRQEIPVALALSQLVLGDKGAWRLQGGGFAGTIQAFVPTGLVPEYKRQLGAVFGDGACHVLEIRAVGCTRVC